MNARRSSKPQKVLVVAGTRPNFMKVAPVLSALRDRGHLGMLVHTGQHYDFQMSGAFLHDLGIAEPDFNLGIGSGSHARQTARIMEAFEPVLLEVRPDWLLVPGDVNSTLACSLVAAKLREATGTRIGHIEAGLRSSDWSMPEEVNRVLTDRLSDVLLTPSRDAHSNLALEGIPEERTYFVGNVMIDTLLLQLPAARRLGVPKRLGLDGRQYAVATLHRPSNVDSPRSLRLLLEALVSLSKELSVVFPVHPRTKQKAETFGLGALMEKLHVTEPLGYLEMLSLMDGAALVLTDSGGMQEETTALGVPCVTLREQTERPVTVTHGTNRLTPWPPSVEGVVRSCRDAISTGRAGVGEKCPEGWDGHAATRIVDCIETFSANRTTAPASDPVAEA